MTDDKGNGPDLTRGIRASDVADGAMLTGSVGEETVLLVRRGDEFLAVDAFCTHYHGPLADGAIVGETIRCPWHHACLNLRTGRAERAPAMRPLRVYQTVRDGDLVRVLPVAPQPSINRISGSEHVVIVGAGAAGSFAAAELRLAGFEGRVTLLTRESSLPYDKPNLSKDYLAGRAAEDWIPLRTSDDYERDRIEIRMNANVESIDPAAREVLLAGGGRIGFDRLVLATGSSPRKIDLPTDGTVHVHYLRTWADASALREVSADAKNAVVIGASFIGLEAAASLRELGLNVTVIGAETLPLEKVLGREIGEFVRRTHEMHGVRFRLGHRPAAIRTGSVVLDDGSAEPADVVVVGVGVIPEVSLAERAGLTIDRGILVNDRLETSAPGIFAAGDAVRLPETRTGRFIRVEHWVAAGRQGQAAARNAMGLQERFDAIPFFWSQHFDLVLAYVGHAESANDVQLFGSLDSHNAVAVLREEGRIAAVVTLFRDDISLAVEAAMERDDDDAALLAIVSRSL